MAHTVIVKKNTAAVVQDKDAIETKDRNSLFPLKAKNIKLGLGKGWKFSSTGGLSYVNPENSSHWFKLSGVMRFDETFFMGSHRDKQNDFPNGANIRAIEAYLDGGVGENWEYTVQLAFRNGQTFFSDTWISYLGLLTENNQIFVGRISGNWFGLDNSNSTSWNAFLERSLPSIAFYPGDGIGAMTDVWGDSWAVTLSASQPDQSIQPNVRGGDRVAGMRDRWKGTLRATVAPLHEVGDVWHFGVSGAWREIVTKNPNGAPVLTVLGYSANPSARARSTRALLDTTTGNNGAYIRANNVKLFNVEVARQYGPFMLEGEYTDAYVNRIGDSLGTVRFAGWNLQTRYMLTGEVHAYDVRDGNFGSIDPKGTHGAFEVVARYDFLDLNSKNVRGGTEHDVTVGLNWFVNPVVRLSANYIRANIHPANNAQKRNLDIIGLRAQLRFK